MVYGWENGAGVLTAALRSRRLGGTTKRRDDVRLQFPLNTCTKANGINRVPVRVNSLFFFSGHVYTYVYWYWNTGKQYAELFLRFSLCPPFGRRFIQVLPSECPPSLGNVLYVLVYARVCVCICMLYYVFVRIGSEKQMRIYNALVFVFLDRLKNVKTQVVKFADRKLFFSPPCLRVSISKPLYSCITVHCILYAIIYRLPSIT